MLCKRLGMNDRQNGIKEEMFARNGRHALEMEKGTFRVKQSMLDGFAYLEQTVLPLLDEGGSVTIIMYTLMQHLVMSRSVNNTHHATV